ncbi:cyclopropane-fatty-acyl-phospholipid synthase-like protein [Dinothrombium tinctorium]|uniref:Cyclopropane-fatty-acyl-phospholipid synthase-like protein n=1 Tax=Dinothrombium tinctorium TaxID=1965070 RepID=A0A3S3NTJ5_9ACAR|nr:cyclopropane-fatty-acyl-phospholipid synthase-like protein [Dinothrombium tinctorium]
MNFYFLLIDKLLRNFILTSIYYLAYILLPITKLIAIHLFDSAGIKINGSAECDPRVEDNRFYAYFIAYSIDGLAHAYKAKFFECNDVNQFLQLICIKLQRIICYHPAVLLPSIATRCFLLPSFDEMYDCTVVEHDTEKDTEYWKGENEYPAYSTCCWDNVDNIKDAYEQKLDIVARKLKLQRGMKLLDIGCGVGVLCRHLAEKYGVSAIGVNISNEQIEKAKQICTGLDVDFEHKDMLQVRGIYDRITCILCSEFAGIVKYRNFFETVHSCLTEGGLFLLEVISSRHFPYPTTIGFVEEQVMSKFSFPYDGDIIKCAKDLFVIEEWQNITDQEIRTCEERIKILNQKYGKHIESSNDEVMARGAKFSMALQQSFCQSGYYQFYRIVFSKI